MEINKLVRTNILKLKPYSSARSEFTGEGSVFLDANESPFENDYNRYPDPLQNKVKEKISGIKNISKESIFLGNGSDEAIDLLFRIFCNPGKDNVIAIAPTYGMYEVCADINDVEYRSVNLDANFDIDTEAVLARTDGNSKIIFLCSPNNPTGNLLNREKMLTLINEFKGIVVVDEAYIDFAPQESFINLIPKYSNLVVLQTFSKAWGQASVRLGMAYSSPEIISYFNKVKYPYNINILTQRHILKVLEDKGLVESQTKEILAQKEYLIEQLNKMAKVKKIFPSSANFVLVRIDDADNVYQKLVDKGIIVRNRSKITLCDGCLRITVGREDENKNLINALSQI